MNLLRAEPILSILVANTTLLPSIFAVFAAFGHPLSDPQQHAIVGLASVVSAIIARQLVVPLPR
jgi:hypothetical protein